MTRRLTWVLGASLVLAAAAGCRSRPFTPAVEVGEKLFGSPTLSSSMFNDFSCATCHTNTDEPPEGFFPSGYSLRNSAFRTSYWGGYEPNLLDATNFCLVYFMRGDPLTRDDPAGRALYEYLASVSPERPSPGLPLTVEENIADVPRGDAARGEEVYETACARCHGSYPEGNGRLNERVSRFTEAYEFYEEEFPELKGDWSLVVIEKVRHGQFFGIGGNMPLYSLEAMSDEDLGALLAYMGL